MTHLKIQIEIDHPAAETFAYISDFANNPQWQAGMIAAEIITPPLLGIGTQYKQTAAFLGRRIDSTFIVTEYEPGQMVKATTVASSFPITFTRSVTANGRKSVVTAIVAGDASRFFKLFFSPLMSWMVAKKIKADYQNLKKILETT